MEARQGLERGLYVNKYRWRSCLRFHAIAFDTDIILCAHVCKTRSFEAVCKQPAERLSEPSNRVNSACLGNIFYSNHNNNNNSVYDIGGGQAAAGVPRFTTTLREKKNRCHFPRVKVLLYV